MHRQLEVSDRGVLFDLQEAERNHGLRRINMEERFHLVHKTFIVESVPGKGTRIIDAVPAAETAEEPATTREMNLEI